MAIFAVIRGLGVSELIVADTKEIAEEVMKTTCIERTDEYPIERNWVWDGTTFIAPPKPIVEEPNA